MKFIVLLLSSGVYYLKKKISRADKNSNMGNYRNLETEFIDRTLELISQYEGQIKKTELEFDKQYNHTLLINCLLGLIVMPKERTIDFLPKDKITITLKNEMGVSNSWFNEEIRDMKSLVIALRHSISHFDIAFNSNDDQFLIDEIVFNDNQKSAGYIVAKFLPDELLNFIRYYGGWIIASIRENEPRALIAIAKRTMSL